MKNISRFLLPVLLLTIGVISCKKDENQIFFEEGKSPVLTASRTGTIPLSFGTSAQEAISLSWTNPDYMFTTGVNSQNVNYLIEIDTTGANFTNPKRQSISVSGDLSRSFTVGQFNDFLLNQLQLDSTKTHNIEIRVTSSISGAVPIYSNVLKFTGVKPFAIPPKVEPPAAGTLWITGDAAPSGWANPLGVPHNVNQKFTKISNTLYELTLNMPGGGAYKLIQEQGVWGTHEYHMLAGGTWEGGDFEKRDADPAFPGPPSGGNFKITVDFQRGKFIVVRL